MRAVATPPHSPSRSHRYFTRANSTPISPPYQTTPTRRKYTGYINKGFADLTSDEEEEVLVERPVRGLRSRLWDKFMTVVYLVTWFFMSLLSLNVWLLSLCSQVKDRVWSTPFPDTQTYSIGSKTEVSPTQRTTRTVHSDTLWTKLCNLLSSGRKDGGISWCGFLFAFLFLMGSIMLFGVLLIPLPLQTFSNTGMADSQKIFSYFESQKSEIEKLSVHVQEDLEKLKSVIFTKMENNQLTNDDSYAALTKLIEDLQQQKAQLSEEIVALASFTQHQKLALEDVVNDLQSVEKVGTDNTRLINEQQTYMKAVTDKQGITYATLTAQLTSLREQISYLKLKGAGQDSSIVSLQKMLDDVTEELRSKPVPAPVQPSSEPAPTPLDLTPTENKSKLATLSNTLATVQEQLREHVTNMHHQSTKQGGVMDGLLNKLQEMRGEIMYLKDAQTGGSLTIKEMKSQIASLRQTISVISKDVTSVRGGCDKSHVMVLETFQTQSKDLGVLKNSMDMMQTQLSRNITDLERSLSILEKSINQRVRTLILNVMMGVTQNAEESQYFSTWLYSTFISREQFHRSVNETKVTPNQDELVNSVLLELQNKHGMNTGQDSGITLTDIHLVVSSALQTYNEDKTGRADFAMEAVGAAVLSIGCTDTYDEGAPYVHFMQVPLYRVPNPPRVALQPDITPGRCWAFKGEHGYLMIRLAHTIRVSGFSMEHLPRSLSFDGTMSSAPKHFIMRGLTHPDDPSPHMYGEYTYLDHTPLQYFAVKNFSNIAYEIVELEIVSNHGNQHYTCLYRIRVHGEVPKIA